MEQYGWSNGHEGNIIACHEWKGLLNMPGALEDLVEKRRLKSQEKNEMTWAPLRPSAETHYS